MPFTQIKNRRLYEEVADQIKQSIFSGEFSPGDRLPSERELCKIFGVGRPAVREALRSLSAIGIIDVKPGISGSFVKEIEITQFINSLVDQISWMIKVGKETASDLWEVRKYIELGIAHSAARRVTPKDLKKLENLIGDMEGCGDDIYAYWQIACEFHKYLALCTRNRVFILIWEIFSKIDLEGYTPILEKLLPHGPSDLLKANREIIEAIKSRDSAMIDKAMEGHAKGLEYFPGAFSSEEK
jgi:GntR family transcriptional repressor for pyruvate dehydrogenase complex